MSESVHTVVIGAGIAGLAYAHALGEGADVLVLEASSRVGGLIRTEHHDDEGGFHVECGPEALQDNAPETLELIGELGLTIALADAASHKRFLLRPDNKLLPIPTGPGAFLRSPILTLGGKLRALTEPWRSRDPGLQGSVADFARHRFGEQVLERLIDPFVSGVYAGAPDQLSLRATFPTLHEMVADHGSLMKAMKARARARREAGEDKPPVPSLLSVAGGLEQLPRALARGLGERLVLDCAVERLSPDGDGYRVELAAGRGIHCRRAVLAVPVRAAAGLLAADFTDLFEQLGSMTSEAVVSVAHLWRRQDVAHALDGFGYLVSSSLGLLHLGTVFSSSLVPARCAPDRVLLRTLLGGARHPGLGERSDEELVDLVVAEVGPVLMKAGMGPVWSKVTRWSHALPRYDLAQPGRQRRIDELLAVRPGLAILGNSRRGISVNALVESSRRLAHSHRLGTGGSKLMRRPPP